MIIISDTTVDPETPTIMMYVNTDIHIIITRLLSFCIDETVGVKMQKFGL